MPPAELAATLEHRSGLLGPRRDGRHAGDPRRPRRPATRPRPWRSASTSTGCAASIAAMAAALGGLDVLVFTGGVGENAPAIRARAAADLAFLGVAVDPAANAAAARRRRDRRPRGAPVRTLVVAAREDLEIAREVRAVLGGRQSADADGRLATPRRTYAAAALLIRAAVSSAPPAWSRAASVSSSTRVDRPGRSDS